MSEKLRSKDKTEPKSKLVRRACLLFKTDTGCKFGAKCKFAHDSPGEKQSATPGKDKEEMDLSSSASSVVSEVVKPAALVCATLRDFFNMSVVNVSPLDKDVCDTIADWNDAMPFPGRRPIAHPYSHLCREVVVRRLVSSVVGGLQAARVASVYGAERDLKLVNLVGWTKGGNKISAPECALEVTIGPNKVYPGDAGKIETPHRTDFTGKYNLVYSMDVYWDGENPFGPAQVKSYCALAVDGSMYVVTRMFTGGAGCDVCPEYDGEVEGVWHRDENNMIVFSPDSRHYIYPLHRDMEWLRQKDVLRAHGLSSIYMFTVGPYDVIKVTIESVLTVDVPVYSRMVEPLVEYRTIERPGFVNWMFRKMGVPILDYTLMGCLDLRALTTTSYMGYVHNSTVSKLSVLQKLKATTGNILDSVRAAAQTNIRTNQVLLNVFGRFPRFEEALIEGTADAVMFEDKKRAIDRYVGMRSDVNASETALMAARTTVASGGVTTRSRVAFMYLLGLALVAKMGYFFGAHAHILPFGEGGLVCEEPWFLGGLIVMAFIVAGFIQRSRSLERKGIFKTWEQNHYNMEIDDNPESAFEVLPAGSQIRAVHCQYVVGNIGLGKVVGRLNSNVFMSGEGEPSASFLECREALLATKDRTTRLSTTVIAATNGHLWRPDRSNINIFAGAVGRLHAAVNDSDDQSWRSAYLCVSPLLEGHTVDPWTLERCAENMGGAKGKRLLDSYFDLEQGVLKNFRKEVTLKHNETIGLKTYGDILSIRPRCIVVLSNEVHSVLSPWAHGFSDLMHQVFDGRHYGDVRIWYADKTQLDEIGRAAYGLDDFIAASGDDTLTCFYHKFQVLGLLNDMVLPYKEGDYSAMDQSEKESCIDMHCEIMRARGVPPCITQFYFDVSTANYVVKSDDGETVLVMKGETGTQLSTGIDFTTVCNSLTAITSWLFYLHILEKGKRSVDPAACMLKLGLTLKCQHLGHASQVTFLKGWFAPSDTGVIWQPLPSQVLKIGKLMRPLLAGETVEIAAYAISRSFATISDSLPILGPFIAMMRRLGTVSNKILSASEDGWYKPTATSAVIDRSYVLNMLCDRYETTIEEIEDCEFLIGQVNALPAFIQHPLFIKLMKKDYF